MLNRVLWPTAGKAGICTKSHADCDLQRFLRSTTTFGLLFRNESPNLGSGVAWGWLFGLMWWYLGPLTLLPLDAYWSLRLEYGCCFRAVALAGWAFDIRRGNGVRVPETRKSLHALVAAGSEDRRARKATHSSVRNTRASIVVPSSRTRCALTNSAGMTGGQRGLGQFEWSNRQRELVDEPCRH